MRGKIMLGIILSVLMVSVAFSQGGTATTQISRALNDLRDVFCGILPALIGALVLFAAVIFAAGQMVGAETRARANVWATNMLIGAAIGILVYVLVPWFLGMLFSGAGWTITCAPSSNP